MRRFLIAVAVMATTASATAFATDVGISVTIGQPGFYGQIDIGGYPRPVLLYPQPIMVERVPVGRPPLYLRVPPGHAKHWDRHCHEYRACGERVYFVKDDWYHREYVPRYQERHGGRYDDNRSDYREDDRGNNGNGNRGHEEGKGHGKKNK